MSPEIAKKPGRKRIKVDLEKVEELASRGLGPVQIARALGVSWNTIDRNRKRSAEFEDTLKRGKAKGLATVTNSLFQNALDGNVTAQIFYLKNTDPETWSDRQQVDHQVNLNDIIRDRKVLIDKGQVRDRTEQEPKKALTTAYKEGGPVVLNQKTQKNKDLSVAPSSKPSNNEQLEGED